MLLFSPLALSIRRTQAQAHELAAKAAEESAAKQAEAEKQAALAEKHAAKAGEELAAEQAEADKVTQFSAEQAKAE